MRTHQSRFLEDSRDGVRQVILAVFVWFWCVVYTTYNDISLLTPEENRTLPDRRRYSSGILCLLFPAFDCLSTFTCLAPSRRSLGVSGGDPWGLIDAIVSLDSTQSFQCSRPCSLQSSFLLSATMIVVFALTGVCEGNGQSVGVAEAFAKRRYNGLLGAISQYFPTLFVLLRKMSYHNKRAEAAEDQTPENGGLVARGPVDVLARRGPESDGSHDVYVVICW